MSSFSVSKVPLFRLAPGLWTKLTVLFLSVRAWLHLTLGSSHGARGLAGRTLLRDRSLSDRLPYVQELVGMGAHRRRRGERSCRQSCVSVVLLPLPPAAPERKNTHPVFETCPLMMYLL